ncbi:MAG: ABC transporter permease [Candidatus Humimicrobiaceae bacterium]
MKAFINHFAFEFKTGIRDKNLLLLNYLFPLGFYVLISILMANINPVFVETLIPAMILISVLASTLLGLPDPYVKMREAGIFRSYKVNGVPASSIVIIPPLTIILHMVVVSIIIVSTASIFFGAPLPLNWINFILVFILTLFASTGLGVLIGVASSNTRATVLWSQLFFLPSMMIGGFFIPAQMLPLVIKKISLLLPVTHAFNLFKYFSYQQYLGYDPLWSMLILFAGGIIAFSLAIFLFNWDSKNNTRRGHPALAFLVLIPYIAGAIFLS